MKTRGEIRCPIANTRVKHSKKAKLNKLKPEMYKRGENNENYVI
jgi:hypothetical protein